MKPTKIPTQLAKNASKLHKHIGQLLVEIYPHFDVRQEISVSKINPDFPSNREKFDWAVLRMNIVIEVHGIQHYQPTCFGGITMDQAKRNFVKRQEVDFEKEMAARYVGWAYVVVKHDEKRITKDELYERIVEAIQDAGPAQETKRDRLRSTIQSPGFRKDGPKRKIQSRGFEKPKDGYKWPTRKINN